MINILEKFRHRLGSVDAVPQLAIVGVATGVLTALVIIFFRVLIELAQASFLSGGTTFQASSENYEGLSWIARLVLPVLGAIIIAFIWSRVEPAARQVGVVHVLERVAHNQAYLPLKNFLLQFVGAAVSIVCGHSVGREGPGIHLGAASGSLLGQALQLPNNTLRTLVACGTAAAIGASFNTPIAGVIFAMEVIVMEYSIAGFTPIILASVSATLLTQLVFGNSPAFKVPALMLSSPWEMPIIILLGLLIGLLAAGFNRLLQWTTNRAATIELWSRFLTAGILTGVVALFVPQIMGVGYDTVSDALSGQTTITLLAVVVVAKLVVTALGIGLGLPGGLIGPCLMIGACVGGLVGLVVGDLFPSGMASPGFYAMLGMGGMMAAVLQAPLAALMALLELTVNTHIILPGMLTVTVAVMTTRHTFGCNSVFMMLLKARGLDYSHHPVTQSLRRAGVTSVMTTSFSRLPLRLTKSEAEESLATGPRWGVIWDDSQDLPTVLRSADLVRALESEELDIIELMEIPAERIQCECISHKVTLQEALDKMLDAQSQMLCVTRDSRRFPRRLDSVIGVITRDMIESYYQYP